MTDHLLPPRLAVYGDFNCPWSYLAFRRARVLAAAGVQVEWCAVEHDPWTPGGRDRGRVRIAALQEEMHRVLAMLLPGEDLPYDLAGFVPWTRAAVAAYAESHVAGAATSVGRLLFESFWMHGLDLGDAGVLRTLLVDELRGGGSSSEAVHAWGHPVDVTGGPISTAAWQTVGRWRDEWRDSGKEVVPLVLVPDAAPVHGVDAVEWLGRQVQLRGLAPSVPAAARPAPAYDRDLPALGWITAHGGPWLRRCQEAVAVGHPVPR